MITHETLRDLFDERRRKRKDVCSRCGWGMPVDAQGTYECMNDYCPDPAGGGRVNLRKLYMSEVS